MRAPATLSAEYIAGRWPRLFHMAEAGAWPSIERHGLLSTSALLDLFEIAGRDREAIESACRPESVDLKHPERGTAWIRDNKPINTTVLRRALVGMSESEWYRTLNGRVFLWLSEGRLDRLRAASSDREREHDILTFDNASLLAAHAPEVELAHLNTGAACRAAPYTRGTGTFSPIAAYPWTERLRIAPAEPIRGTPRPPFDHEAVLTAATQAARAEGLQVSTHVRDEDPPEALIAVAEGHDADLLVLDSWASAARRGSSRAAGRTRSTTHPATYLSCGTTRTRSVRPHTGEREHWRRKAPPLGPS